MLYYSTTQSRTLNPNNMDPDNQSVISLPTRSKQSFQKALQTHISTSAYVDQLMNQARIPIKEVDTRCHVCQSSSKCNSGVDQFRSSNFCTFHPNESKNSPPKAKDHRDDSKSPGDVEES